MKKATIRFYTDFKRYKGWCYLLKCDFNEVKSWIKSGNNIVIHGVIFNEADKQRIREIKTLCDI